LLSGEKMKKKKYGKKYLISLILLAICGINMLLFHSFPDFFFPVYRNISSSWQNILSTVFSFTKVAVWDIGLIVLALAFIFYTITVIVGKRGFLTWLSNVLLVVCILVFVAVNGWMLNHYAPKLSESVGLTIEKYSEDELYDSCEYYLLKAAEYADKIARDDDYHALESNFNDMAKTAGNSYESLRQKYPVFKGSNKPVKRLSVVGEYLMYNGIVGMFMPLTGESGVPESVPPVPMAFTMCHEAAHRLGIASEQEANYAAFLACVNSKESEFLYSGYYSAFSYCFSSLYSQNQERAMTLYEKYSEDRGVLLVRLDRHDTFEHYRKYESVLQDISDDINDTYLKTFSQESGIRSYGEVTDYLIAYYLILR
ncbi:MAG: DUF3810 domain-containing protein, partial [Erysipelotrichaceae bacterium]|nr:DUF3810 domain-containing protein [Erysipelotrichaceae bacterium]